MIRRQLNRRPSDFWQQSSHTGYFITSKSFSHGFRRGVAFASLCICVNTLRQFFTILDHCYKQLCRDTSQGVLGAFKFRVSRNPKGQNTSSCGVVYSKYASNDYITIMYLFIFASRFRLPQKPRNLNLWGMPVHTCRPISQFVF
jgi:hypothetical protein